MSNILKLSTHYLYSHCRERIILKPLPSPNLDEEINFNLNDSFESVDSSTSSDQNTTSNKISKKQQMLVIEYLDQKLSIL